jgi:HK97 family phage portal protein
MSLSDRLRGGPYQPLYDYARTEHRAQTDLSQFTKFSDVYQGMRSGNTVSGVNITQDTAMTLPVVFRCVQLNCETVSSLPTDCFAKRAGGRVEYATPGWLEKPNDEQDWAQMCAMGQYSYELDGNTFLLKASTETGRLAGLYVLDPLRVTPKRVTLGGRNVLIYEVVMDDGDVRVYPSTAIVHQTGMVPPGKLRGLSPISQMAETLGVFGAAQEFGAAFFGNGATLSGVIEYPNNRLDPEVAERLKQDFTKKHGGVSKSHAIGVLTGGAQFKPLSVSPNEAQFIDTMKFNGVQIAHIFGCPPYMVTDVSGAQGYVTGIMANRLDWYQTGLLPRITRWERAMFNLLPRPAFMKMNIRGLLRGVPAEQAAQMDAEIRNGIRTPNEWCGLLDIEPYAKGNDHYISANLKVVGEKPPEPPPPIMAPNMNPNDESAPADSPVEEAPDEGD